MIAVTVISFGRTRSTAPSMIASVKSRSVGCSFRARRASHA